MVMLAMLLSSAVVDLHVVQCQVHAVLHHDTIATRTQTSYTSIQHACHTVAACNMKIWVHSGLWVSSIRDSILGHSSQFDVDP